METPGLDHGEVKKILLAQRRESLAFLNEGIRGKFAPTREVGDIGDVARESHLSDVQIGVAQMIASKIRRINEAITRIEAGTFGFCENPDCRKEIPIGRLIAQPMAKLCAKCQEEVEASRPRRRLYS